MPGANLLTANNLHLIFKELYHFDENSIITIKHKPDRMANGHGKSHFLENKITLKNINLIIVTHTFDPRKLSF